MGVWKREYAKEYIGYSAQGKELFHFSAAFRKRPIPSRRALLAQLSHSASSVSVVQAARPRDRRRRAACTMERYLALAQHADEDAEDLGVGVRVDDDRLHLAVGRVEADLPLVAVE